jgi:predicted nucleotidyltransferase
MTAESARRLDPDQFPSALVDRKLLRGLLRQLQDDQPVVLVGSSARGLAHSRLSDVDVLVLTDQAVSNSSPRVQVIVVTPSRFEERVMQGDDFTQWALRFGIPLVGKSTWKKLRSAYLPKAPWPNPDNKRRQASRKLEAAKILFEMGDVEAAAEETLLGLSHLARAQLLGHGVYPLSRPELPGQLERVHRIELAQALEGLIASRERSKQQVQRSIRSLEEGLEEEFPSTL